MRVGLSVILVVIVVGLLFGGILWKKYSPSKVKADLNEYYGVTAEGQAAIIINNKVSEAKGVLFDGTFYIPYKAVRESIDSGFYWNLEEGELRYTMPLDVVCVPAESKEYTISDKTMKKDYVIVKYDGTDAYIAVDFMKEYTDMDISLHENPARIRVNNEKGEVTTAKVSKNTQVRWLAGVKSDVLKNVKKGEKVRVIEKEGSWEKVCTEDGVVGYIKESALKSVKKENPAPVSEKMEYTSLTREEMVNLAWHQVTNEAANASVQETLASAPGLTVISPTWFTVADTSGGLNSIAEEAYVQAAHSRNVEVWALVRDFDGGIDSPEQTYQLLSSSAARRTLIEGLLSQVQAYGIDGINVDFEKVSVECGEHFVQFIRELSVECRKLKIVLSVDNYVPMEFNSYYDLGEQGRFADYVIIMGYDEHYGGSYESGSVASIGYVENGIETAVSEVPSGKVINAVPFYTRLWAETPKTAEELAGESGTEAAEYPVKVTSEALGMQEAEERVSQSGAVASWNEKAQQNYAEWQEQDVTYKIWLEDSSSIEAKLKLMHQYKLGGVAAWKLGFEKPEIWSLIDRYVR